MSTCFLESGQTEKRQHTQKTHKKIQKEIKERECHFSLNGGKVIAFHY